MALVTCPDCRTSVSSSARACPKCGRSTGNGPALRIVAGVFVALAAVLLIAASQATNEDTPAMLAIVCFAIAAVFLGVDNYRRGRA